MIGQGCASVANNLLVRATGRKDVGATALFAGCKSIGGGDRGIVDAVVIPIDVKARKKQVKRIVEVAEEEWNQKSTLCLTR